MTPAQTAHTDFIRYPTNRVVGTIGDADKAQAALRALLEAGFAEADIDILHGEQDLHRLDATGVEHGYLAQFQRTLIRVFDLEEFKNLIHHVEDIRAGRFVVMVLAKRRGQRMAAADILHKYGAEFVGFYGRWAWEELPAAPEGSPEAVPAAFARAWNNRDARALAALFDEDAEFVDVSGLVWRDRESIRKAHAKGLEGLVEESILSIDETRVKLLSPDIAVVHARLTVTGNAPRTMVASFVVHRAGERWLCTAAHSTEVTARVAAEVIENAGRLRSADYH